MGEVLVPQFIQTSTAPNWSADFGIDDLLARSDAVALNELRQLGPFIPLLVLIPESSAKGLAETKAAGAELQCESPRSPKALTLMSKESHHPSRPSPAIEYAFGDITVNFPEMVACRNGTPVSLTALEFKTLKYMVRNPRRVISRDELLNEVWGYQNYPCTRTVDNHVLRLRRKLERNPARPEHFRTVHGAGYKFLP